MADELIFEPENPDDFPASSRSINFINFDKAIKGISSQVVTVYLRNDSDKTYDGGIHVVTAESDSYTQDLFVSDDGIVWEKEIFVTIDPQSRVPVRIKTIPAVTPENTTGRAVIALSGGW